MRIGWVFAESHVAQRFVLAKEAADLCHSSFTQFVTEHWLSDRDRWTSSVRTLVDVYRSRRDAMVAALTEHFPDDATWTRPAGGFYCWVTLPEYFDTQKMLAAAVERRVAYVPGTGFYPDDRGRQQMRLAFCYPTEADIVEGVKRLGALLSDEEDLFRSLHP